MSGVKNIISGNFLSRTAFLSRLPVLVWIVVLTVLYIANGFRLQQLHREQLKLEREIARLEVTAVTTRSIRTRMTRESYILEQVKAKGLPLLESVVPPKMIIDEPSRR